MEVSPTQEGQMPYDMFASIDAFAVMSITLFLNRTKHWTQKKRGIVLLSVPRIEALALPICIEQTTSEPTPI